MGIYDLVVCQAEKQVFCEVPMSDGNRTGVHCETEKEVTPVARCNFDAELWNLGGTCISNLVHSDPHNEPQCDDSTEHARTAMARVASECEDASYLDSNVCSKVAMSY